MNSRIIEIKRNAENSISARITQLREKLWYEEDINNIKKKLQQCEVTPLSQEQKKEIIAYWEKLIGKEIPTYWHEYFYSRNEIYSVKYVPTCVYHSEIVYRLNYRPLAIAYADKNFYDSYFSDILRPRTLVRNINGYFYNDKKPISKEEALDICKDRKDMVIKPSLMGRWGRSVKIFSSIGGFVNEKESVSDVLNEYGKNYIIQEKVIQHEGMSKLNPTSLNTIRVLSYRHQEEVFILYAVVRIGRKGKLVDNETAGGINADINIDDGKIRNCAYGTPSEKQIFNTDVGTILKDFPIPSFDKVLALAKDLHLRLPYFNIIGWDFCIDSFGNPMMIEWNKAPDLSQTAHGPAFGDMTEDIVKFAMKQNDTFGIRY